MTAQPIQTIDRPTLTAPTVARAPVAHPVSFGRTAGVEMRKLVDTPSARWIVGGVGAATAAAVIGYARVKDPATWADLFLGLATIASIGLAALTTLLITAEWSRRTSLITFALEPRRLRVMGAKFAAVAGLSGLLVGPSVVAAGIISANTRHAPDWGAGGTAAACTAIVGVFFIAEAAAISTLVRNSAATVGIMLGSMIAWTVGSAMNSQIAKVEAWGNPPQAMSPLFQRDLSASVGAHLGVCALIWIAVPLVVGLITLRRHDFS